MAIEGRVAQQHPHVGAALAAGLRALHALVVEREREAVAVLGVELGQVAAAPQRAGEHPLRQLGRYERQAGSSAGPGSVFTRATIRSQASITRS